MGASQSKKVTAQDRAILDLKIQRDKVHQYQKRIQTVLNRERQVAKEALAQGNKSKALLILRRRKYQEQVLVKADRQLETLEQLTQSIEFALVEKDVVFGLQQGNAVLREINKEMSFESVEKLMDDTAEAIAYQKEVSNLLATRVTNEEEDEVLEEFEQLQREALGLPEVPIHSLPQEDRIEERTEPETAREEERVAISA